MGNYVVKVQFKSGLNGQVKTPLPGDTLGEASRSFALRLDSARIARHSIVLADPSEGTVIIVSAEDVDAIVLGAA